MSVLVEESWPSSGSVALSSSGAIATASTLPSSTPHWSNESMPQIAPLSKHAACSLAMTARRAGSASEVGPPLPCTCSPHRRAWHEYRAGRPGGHDVSSHSHITGGSREHDRQPLTDHILKAVRAVAGSPR